MDCAHYSREGVSKDGRIRLASQVIDDVRLKRGVDNSCHDRRFQLSRYAAPDRGDVIIV